MAMHPPIYPYPPPFYLPNYYPPPLSGQSQANGYYGSHITTHMHFLLVMLQSTMALKQEVKSSIQQLRNGSLTSILTLDDLKMA
jgi:hypothetical protein